MALEHAIPRWLRVGLLCAMLAGGAGASSDEAGGRRMALQAQGASAAASAYGVVAPEVAVEQLLDFGEVVYPTLFPGHQQTQTSGPFRYRFYPQTGIYLGVAVGVTPKDDLDEGSVYVAGGQFGSAPLRAGSLLSFVTPVVPMPSELEAAPGMAAVYVANLPSAPEGTGAPCSNRAAWQAAGNKITAITVQADALLAQPFPAWSDSLYRAQDVSVGETMMASRKAWLYPLVLAECASWRGKYTAAIRTTLRELATQSAWAHPSIDPLMKGINNGDWYQDLMSAALAHELAQALYLLGDRVDADTRALVAAALEARVFQPVRRTLVDGYNSWWLTTPINWNAVMLADIVGAALAVIPSRQDRARFAAVGQHYIQNFVAPFAESGYGHEGPAYWTYAVKHFALLRHRLQESSAGAVDLLKAAKPRAFSLYSARIEMTPQGAVAPFGDALMGTTVDAQTRAYLAAAYGNSGSWPGNARVRVSGWHNDMPLVEASMLLTESVPVATDFESAEFGQPGLHSYFADVGVLVTRSPTSEVNALAATIKSAGNGNHGHDDVGSYAIAVNGQVVAGDVGFGNTTARTFSPQRREIKWINSWGHPVPVLGGRLQIDATAAVNTVQSTSFTDATDDIAIDMAPAYALPAGWSLVRRLRNDRVNRVIIVQDEFSASSSPQSFEVPITTTGTWTQVAPNRLRFQRDAQLQAVVEASAPFSIVGEQVTEDGFTYQRVAIRLNAAVTSGWVRVTFSR